MIEIGSVIRATVIEVAPYGVYLQHGNEKGIVLAPEVSWLAKGDVRQRAQVGAGFDPVTGSRKGWPVKFAKEHLWERSDTEKRDGMMTPLPADKALDAYFLEARCKLLDLAAILDRIGRGADSTVASADPRLARVR